MGSYILKPLSLSLSLSIFSLPYCNIIYLFILTLSICLSNESVCFYEFGPVFVSNAKNKDKTVHNTKIHPDLFTETISK
jgi:hypothetical protein